MRIKLITLSYDPETEAFPPDPLSDLEGEILSVVEHFFFENGRPRLLLIVHHRAYRELPTRGQQGSSAIRQELQEPDRLLFDKLRAWRNGRAQAEGVPPYVLLTNRQLGEIAKRRPTTLRALCEIDGIGDQRAGRYGRDLLSVITPPPPSTVPAQIP